MRYRIKVYTLADKARELTNAAVRDGIIGDPEVTAGFVEGSADEESIRLLSERGLTVRPLAPLPEVVRSEGGTPARGSDFAPTLSRRNLRRGSGAASVLSRASSPDRAGHYLLRLRGSVTRAFRNRLELLGATLIERDEDGRYVTRIDAPLGPIRADPDVEDVQAYGVRQTLRGRSAQPNPNIATRDMANELSTAEVLEATLHPGFDARKVADEIEARGGIIISVAARVVRLALGDGRIEDLAAMEQIAEIQPAGFAGLLHDAALPLVGVVVPEGGARALPYRGEGEVVGIADSGIDESHPDFAGRIRSVVARGRPGDASDFHGHGTHVAGTIAGDGSASEGKLAGVAPAAEIVVQSVMDENGGLGGLPLALGELFQEAYDLGVRVHNNSWGAFLHGRYASMSYAVDEFVLDHPDFLPVIAAGNDGSCNPGTNVRGQQGFVDYPSMSAPASCKNGLTVGASRSTRADLGFARLTYGEAWPRNFSAPPIADDHVSGDPECLAGFSGRGPCDDMRVKPDVVAPGTDIASTRSAKAPLRNFWGPYPRNPNYAVMGGTSMACPIVTGLAVIVRQYFRTERSHQPSAALLKAAIVNGATRLEGRDATAPPGGMPSYHQGFGRVDASRSVPDPRTKPFALSFVDQEMPSSPLGDTGDFVRFAFEVTEPGELRFCLAWTDIPGRALQNALLMQVEDARGQTWNSNEEAYAPVGFDVPDPLAAVPGLLKRDPNNNLHVIRIADPQPGEHVVSVVADNLLRGPQGFALVATGPVRDLIRIDN